MASGTILRHGFTGVNSISIPYTAQLDGMINIILAMETGGGNAYCYINAAGERRAAFLGEKNGGMYSMCFPVVRGETVSVYAETGIASKSIKYFPLV